MTTYQPRAEGQVFRFDGFEVDLDREAVLHEGQPQALRPKSFAVLRCLLEHQGKLVSRDTIIDAVWGNEGASDISLNQCLIEIRRLLGDDNHQMIRTVPRRGYVFEAEIERDSGFDSDSGTTPARKPLRLGIGAFAATLLLALVFLLAQKEEPVPPAAPQARNDIAVLRFTLLGPSRDLVYFADGISEEILNELAKNSELSVVARTSSFRFRTGDEDIRSIARQLDVAHVLEGSVRIQGDQARITAQLIDAASGAHIWSQAFETALDDPFGVQIGIAQKVAAAMPIGNAERSAPDSHPTPSPEAVMLVMRGQALYHQRSLENALEARDLFLQATESDPDYALAWARLAAAIRVIHGRGGMTYDEALEAGVPAAARALELRPDLAEVQIRAGNYEAMTGNREAAIERYLHGLKLEPNHPTLLATIAGIALIKDQLELAIQLMAKSIQLDPLSASFRHNYAEYLFLVGEFDQMREEVELVRRLRPDLEVEYDWMLARAWLVEREFGRAVPIIDTLPEGSLRDQGMAMLRDVPGYSNEASAAMARVEMESTIRAAISLAEIYAFLGDADGAFHWLDIARHRFETDTVPHLNFTDLGTTRFSPTLGSLHADPRWAEWDAFILGLMSDMEVDFSDLPL